MQQRGSALAAAIVGVALCLAVSQMFGERFSAVALLVAALSCYYLGARFYSAFLAGPVLELDDGRPTPAHRLRDERDYLPYRRWTLFGMHFAWIAGPGPLIGPTLAAQFGYLPGFVWIVLGAVLMGCVQDMVILTFSVRRDGMSLAAMIKREISPYGGFLALLLILFILEIILGVLALFVVNALRGSPWGTFTIAASIPIAFLVGWYMTRLRPGAEGQATALGVGLLIGATAAGGWVADHPALAGLFTLTSAQLAVAVVIYGFLAASLPAWMHPSPRDAGLAGGAARPLGGAVLPPGTGHDHGPRGRNRAALPRVDLLLAASEHPRAQAAGCKRLPPTATRYGESFQEP